MAFVKLDTGILDSTLWIERDVREVFITALLMAEPKEFEAPNRQIKIGELEFSDFEAPPGWYGFVPAASLGIINRAGVEREAGMDALRKLGEPEIESRSKEFEGRRMIRVNGGFLILNYMKYRDKDHTAAERQRRLRDRKKAEAVTRDTEPVTRDESLLSRNVTQADSRGQIADAKAEGNVPQRTVTVDEFNEDPAENIPEGLALTQYAGFLMQELHIPAGSALTTKTGDAIGLLAREEACGHPEATRRMLDRMRTAQATGPVKWLFWLEDGGWKQRAAFSIGIEDEA